MADLAFSNAERDFLRALGDLGVRYMVVGLGAAVLQGADTVTMDVDLWFENRADPRIAEAANRAGGVWVAGHFGAMPPMLGGEMGDRFDVVLTVSGLSSFEAESSNVRFIEVDGITLPVLALSRVIASKRAAGRPKDLAVLPALEAALAAGHRA
jgi:hypothetical protein